MKFLINIIRKILKKDRIKYITAPSKSDKKGNINFRKDSIDNKFKTDLIYKADPEINDGNGYKIKQVNLKDMV